MWRAQHALRALDVRTGERVAMVVNDEPAFMAWFLGGLRSGVVPVPLSTMLTADDLAAIVEDAGAGVVVVSADYAGHLPAIAKSAPELRAAVVLGDPGSGGDVGLPVHAWSEYDVLDEAPVAATGPDSPGFWLYSSGTTGLPKGVMHRHANLQATAETYARVRAPDRAGRPDPVRGQAVLRVRAGQLADLPLLGRRVDGAEPGPPHAARRGRAAGHAAPDAVLRRARVRRRAARRRRPRGDVRLGAAAR